MAIDQLMYFALGFLLALLLAIMIVPSVWKRAVRLTKTRIEAATPITMAEFRADKDQLRAEFALSTRRLETTIQTLRTRLAEQLGDLNARASELAILRAEARKHNDIVSDMAEHENLAHERIVSLEREIASLAQQLRNRDRDIADLQVELQTERLMPANDSDTADTNISTALTDNSTADGAMDQAQTRIANAETQLNALLKETGLLSTDSNSPAPQSLADKFSEEDRVGSLQDKIVSVEEDIAQRWKDDTLDKGDLRNRLGDIASLVSQLVYATDSDPDGDADESLFDRVQKFAGVDLAATEQTNGHSNGNDTITPAAKTSRPVVGGTVSDRLAAFENIHANN